MREEKGKAPFAAACAAGRSPLRQSGEALRRGRALRRNERALRRREGEARQRRGGGAYLRAAAAARRPVRMRAARLQKESARLQKERVRLQKGGARLKNGSARLQKERVRASVFVRALPWRALLTWAVLAALLLGMCLGCAAVGAADTGGFTVVLDAGHGGVDPGVAAGGVRESDINLLLVKELRRLFADAGFRVVLTRKNAGGLYGLPTPGFKRRDMAERRRIIQEAAPDLVISVHQNSFPAQPSRSGAQVYYKKGDAAASRLAACIAAPLSRACGGRCAALVGDYYILNCSSFPSVIVECGFLSNAAERQKLCTAAYRRTLARAIFGGALAFL